jgi:hypothetical protein
LCAGQAYVCVKNAFLYTYSGVKDGEIYYIQEPGDDQFDVKNWNTTAEWLGTCMDIRYDYMHTMCPTPSASGVMVALTGCTAKLGWGLSYCGAIVDRAGPDFLSTSINERSLEYPRILVPGSMVNGDQEPEISCGEGITCRNICENMARTARTGNLPVSLQFHRPNAIPCA